MDHLARHRLADLFLDTLPYNAHTTASDALWTGLPLLTCAGNTFAGRVAGSLLRAIGLPELITSSLNDYEAMALRLARDGDLLAGIRARLARNKWTHPLFDTERFARNIEVRLPANVGNVERGAPARAVLRFTATGPCWPLIPSMPFPAIVGFLGSNLRVAGPGREGPVSALCSRWGT